MIDGVQAPDVTRHDLSAAEADHRRPAAGAIASTSAVAIEDRARPMIRIFKLFPLMLALMLTVLMVQLQSFSRLFLVFLTAPLGIIGASLGLNLMGRPFGFVALLGLIALAGMIMRNTVILVDQIEADVAAGERTRREAIVEATVRRARPVILTALAADPRHDSAVESAFWGPMATTIMGGCSSPPSSLCSSCLRSMPCGSARASTSLSRRPQRRQPQSRRPSRPSRADAWRRNSFGERITCAFRS